MGLEERADIERCLDRLQTDFGCDPVEEPGRARAILSDLVGRSGRSHESEIHALAVTWQAMAERDPGEVVDAVGDVLDSVAPGSEGAWALGLVGADRARPPAARGGRVRLLVGAGVVTAAIIGGALVLGGDDDGGDDQTISSTTTTVTTTTTATSTSTSTPTPPDLLEVAYETDTVPEGLVDVRREWLVNDDTVSYVVEVTANASSTFVIQHRETIPVALAADLRPDVEQFTPAGDTMSIPLELAAGESMIITFTGTTDLVTVEAVEEALDVWEQRRAENRQELNPDDEFFEVEISRQDEP